MGKFFKLAHGMDVGSMVEDINKSCPHHGAKGKVVKSYPNEITFIVSNKGENYEPGDKLTKTISQMEKIGGDETMGKFFKEAKKKQKAKYKGTYHVFSKKMSKKERAKRSAKAGIRTGIGSGLLTAAFNTGRPGNIKASGKFGLAMMPLGGVLSYVLSPKQKAVFVKAKRK